MMCLAPSFTSPLHPHCLEEDAKMAPAISKSRTTRHDTYYGRGERFGARTYV